MPAHSDTIAVGAIAVVIAGVDQISKSAVVSMLGPGQAAPRYDVLDGWLALEYAENRGAAFGLFSGLAPILALGSLAIVLALLVQYGRVSHPPRWQTAALGAIVGGAIGNLIDRMRLGYVVDFVAIGSWPNFNVADSAITVGVLTLLWGWMRPGAAASAAEPV